MPLLLNLSQCKLKQGEFYPTIEHCSTVLSVHPGNTTIRSICPRLVLHSISHFILQYLVVCRQ